MCACVRLTIIMSLALCCNPYCGAAQIGELSTRCYAASVRGNLTVLYLSALIWQLLPYRVDDDFCSSGQWLLTIVRNMYLLLLTSTEI